jgi:hypothetical protein
MTERPPGAPPGGPERKRASPVTLHSTSLFLTE